jgi:hypothetical protein
MATCASMQIKEIEEIKKAMNKTLKINSCEDRRW